MSIEKIATLLDRCSGPEKNFPPTDLYNEGWMLRLVLDWFSSNPGIDHDLAFSPTDRKNRGLTPVFYYFGKRLD